MSQSLSKIYVHLVFSTKDRDDVLPKDHLKEVHAYLGGVVKACGGKVLIVGGTTNHIHILYQQPSTQTLAYMVQHIKSYSSKWMKTKYPSPEGFAWQEGYAAFSVSQSGIEAVTEYISNQERHHRRRNFKEELIGLLEKYQIEYDERHLWT